MYNCTAQGAHLSVRCERHEHLIAQGAHLFVRCERHEHFCYHVTAQGAHAFVQHDHYEQYFLYACYMYPSGTVYWEA